MTPNQIVKQAVSVFSGRMAAHGIYARVAEHGYSAFWSRGSHGTLHIREYAPGVWRLCVNQFTVHWHGRRPPGEPRAELTVTLDQFHPLARRIADLLCTMPSLLPSYRWSREAWSLLKPPYVRPGSTPPTSVITFTDDMVQV